SGGTRVVAASPGAGRVVAVADLDGDGRDDLVLQRAAKGSGGKDEVVVLRGAKDADLVASPAQATFSSSEFTR
ncbi:VCBS repeat-containing protein, partial [Streptomyces sp. SID14478]|nr:VCBS repeat-containing protein [Streptomyces sp. SID14478]